MWPGCLKFIDVDFIDGAKNYKASHLRTILSKTLLRSALVMAPLLNCSSSLLSSSTERRVDIKRFSLFTVPSQSFRVFINLSAVFLQELE